MAVSVAQGNTTTVTGARGTLASMLETLRKSIEVDSLGLRISPQIIDRNTVPETDLNRRFSFELQSTNTGQYRDRIAIRIDHTLTVSVLVRVNPHRQHTSKLESLDIEETIIEALMDQSDTSALAITYSATRRQLLASREYLLVAIAFAVRGDLPITS